MDTKQPYWKFATLYKLSTKAGAGPVFTSSTDGMYGMFCDAPETGKPFQFIGESPKAPGGTIYHLRTSQVEGKLKTNKQTIRFTTRNSNYELVLE